MKAVLEGVLARFRVSTSKKVIAVFAGNRAELESAVRHARTSAVNLPVWAFCAEALPEEPAPIDDCAHLVSGPASRRFRQHLAGVWPALTIVAWTGIRGSSRLKIRPFFVPPFRVLVMNEAGDFFPATPAGITRHVMRRTRDAAISASRRFFQVSRSIAWRSFERIRDVILLAWSFVFRSGQRIRDGVLLLWSLIYRASERIADFFNWIWGIFLAGLAHSAEWTSPLTHSAVRGLRQRRLRISPAGTEDSFIEVKIASRAWPRRRVMQAIEKSDAQWLVFRWRTEAAGPDEIRQLIAIARKTDAFAAAKQMAHSAWRKTIVVKHPFRRLQKGEVSEVFAPFSTLLVVRRRIVGTLGLPRALSYGGALSILFWRTSAAGLRSVVVGHEGLVTDEPGMDLEDTELSLRLMTSRSLAALGSLRPSRFRGNVAWSPAHRRPFRGRPRVLVVSPYLPFPLSHGGAVRIWNLCRALADRVDFVLACFREANDTVHYEKLHEVFREVYVVDQDEKPNDSTVPQRVAEYRNPAMTDLIRSFCLEHRVDVVQLEYTQLAGYRDDTGAVPVILVEHDITFTLYRQLADLNPTIDAAREYQQWLNFEREALQCSSMVWTVSKDDLRIARDYGAPRGDRTVVIPNGVDLCRFTPVPEQSGPPRVLFVGSLRHLPNLLALEALRESIMPKVWREIPNAILHVIAGPAHRRAAELAGKTDLLRDDARVIIEGFVEDVRPAYNAATVVAIPLLVSAGTNIKVMEAMACGRTIVSTPVGCQGLDLDHGRELIVAEPDDFAAALIEVISCQDLRGRITREARATAEARFGWETIAAEALCYYTALIDRPVNAPV